MSVNVTPGQLAAQIVVGCMPIIQGGAPSGRLPVSGQTLSATARAELGANDPLGLPEQGKLLAYPLGPDVVFFDLGGSVATIWFLGADCDKACAILDAALKKAYPKVRQTDERVHPDDPEVRVRFYLLDVDSVHIASIEVTYPARATAPARFSVRVRAVRRPNVN